MSAMKNWLMEMQEHANDVLEHFYYKQGEDECRDLFLHKYPGQEQVFNNVLQDWLDNVFQDNVGC